MRSLVTLLGALQIMLLACGGSDNKPDTPAPPASAGLAEDECMKLLDHFLDVRVEEFRQTRPPEEVPTDVQIDKLRRAFRETELDKCIGQDRAMFDCAMSQSSSKGIAQCMVPPQTTPPEDTEQSPEEPPT